MTKPTVVSKDRSFATVRPNFGFGTHRQHGWHPFHGSTTMPLGVYGEACPQRRPAPIPVGSPQPNLLQFPSPDTKVLDATPAKRRGKSMSRRTGQEGHIERSGKWWVVRQWQDVPGRYQRSHMRARICPISGAGKLSASERKRRAREIVAESGADSVEHFNKVVQQQKKDCVTLKQQASRWLEHLRKRKRKPVEPGTIDEWERILNKEINPEIGDCPISNVNNGVLKKLVALMVDKGLSGKSIENYLQVPKMVVASVVDDEGNQVYPRKWNHEFMDVPLVEKSKQNTPSFSSEIMAHSRNGRSRRNVCCSFFAVRLALG
jgi:hypothetical protein